MSADGPIACCITCACLHSKSNASGQLPSCRSHAPAHVPVEQTLKQHMTGHSDNTMRHSNSHAHKRPLAYLMQYIVSCCQLRAVCYHHQNLMLNGKDRVANKRQPARFLFLCPWSLCEYLMRPELFRALMLHAPLHSPWCESCVSPRAVAERPCSIPDAHSPSAVYIASMSAW